MTAKISVIIPVYNVEKYLRQCLDSVINQTLKDIEIICVDDGSTDGSGAILDEYAANDERIKVIHKENGGLGSARNEGLRYVNAEYIFFLDSDDFIIVDTLEKMYNKSKLLDLDICVCGGTNYDTETGEHHVMNYSINKKYLPQKDVFSSYEVKDTLFHLFIGWVWDKLYKTSLIVDNKLDFPPFRNTEDTSFTYFALILSNRIGIVDEPLHAYRRNVVTSVSKTRESEPDAFIKAMLLLKECLEAKNLYSTFKIGYLNYFITFSKWHLDTISDSHRKNLYKKIKYFINSNINKNEHLSFIENYIADLYEHYQKCPTYKAFKNSFEVKDHYSSLERIFSVKNYHDKRHKIVTFLGLKIKIRRKI